MTFVGPTWPVENGSVVGPLHTVSDYAIHMIKKMQNENIHSWVPRQDVTVCLSRKEIPFSADADW